MKRQRNNKNKEEDKEEDNSVGEESRENNNEEDNGVGENGEIENEESEEIEESEENTKKVYPREYYEQAYIDFLRHQKPDYAVFVEFVNQKFKKANYNIRDYLSELPRDALCCMVDYLSMFDVCRLVRTCKSLSKITNDSKFNDYWKNRQRKIFNGLVENNGIYNYKLKKRSILWFDVYQWGVITKTGIEKNLRKRLKHNKQVFHSWLKCKRKETPKIFSLNVLYGHETIPYLEKTFEFPIPPIVSSTLEIPQNLVTLQILIEYLKQ